MPRGGGRGRGRGPSLAQYLLVSLGMGAAYMLVVRTVILDIYNPISWMIFAAWTLFSGYVWYHMTRG